MDENKEIFTKDEVENIVKRKVEEDMMKRAYKNYAISAKKLVNDYGNEMSKTRVLDYDSETIKTYLESPDKYYKQLLDISLATFISIPQYQNLIKYYVDMVLLCPYIIPIKMSSSKAKLKKEYLEAGYLLDKMNIELEFKKVIANTIRDGVFYGYELEENDSYSIKQLNPKYCRVIGATNGKWTYQFDFSYFDGKKYLETSDSLVKYFPKEFLQKYNIYKKNSKMKWQTLDIEKQICTRWNPDLNSPTIDFPPLTSLIPDILNLGDYKDMNKVKTKNDNYRFVALEMQTNGANGEMNKFTVDPSFVGSYYDFLVEVCGDGITPFMSPVPVKELNFGSKATEINQVQNAEKSFYNASSVSEVMFGSGTSNAGTLKYSSMVDQNKLYGLYNQIENIITLKLNMNFNNVYKVKLPKITTFNRGEYKDELVKLVTLGVPVLQELMAVSNISNIEAEGLLMVEETFDYISRMKPLNSSYTTSWRDNPTNSSAGRPTSSNPSDSTISNQDNATDENKV